MTNILQTIIHTFNCSVSVFVVLFPPGYHAQRVDTYNVHHDGHLLCLEFCVFLTSDVCKFPLHLYALAFSLSVRSFPQFSKNKAEMTWLPAGSSSFVELWLTCQVACGFFFPTGIFYFVDTFLTHLCFPNQVGSFIIMNMCAVVIATYFANTGKRDSTEQDANAVTLWTQCMKLFSRLTQFFSRSDEVLEPSWSFVFKI